MKEGAGHGKRVQKNKKNTHVNNIIITRVTVICLKNTGENEKNNVGLE